LFATVVTVVLFSAAAAVLVSSSSLRAGLILNGLTLVQEGPVASASGDPVPANLATGATPFSSSDFGGIHAKIKLND